MNRRIKLLDQKQPVLGISCFYTILDVDVLAYLTIDNHPRWERWGVALGSALTTTSFDEK